MTSQVFFERIKLDSRASFLFKLKFPGFLNWDFLKKLLEISVTRYGNLSPFWQFLEAFGNNFFAQNRQFIKALM